MKKSGIRAAVIAAILICFMLSGCANSAAANKDSVSIWYINGDSLAPRLEELAEQYNKTIAGDTLPVSLRSFENEQELAAAFATVAPDILLCTHAKAIDLYERGALRDLSSMLGSELPDYSEEILQRFDGVSRSFFPIGSAVQVLLLKQGEVKASELADFQSLFAYAAKYGEENNAPFLTADSFASVFYEAMLSQNLEFHASEALDLSKTAYRSTYNTIAEAAYSGGLVALDYAGLELVQGGYMPSAIVSSAALANVDLTGYEIHTLPQYGANKACLATSSGLAITVREGRSRASCAAFMRWLFESERLYTLSLDSGLAPAVSGTSAQSDMLSAFLLEISRQNILHLPDYSSDFMKSSAEFEARFRKAISFLN